MNGNFSYKGAKFVWWDLESSLIHCGILGDLACLVLGDVSISAMFSNSKVDSLVPKRKRSAINMIVIFTLKTKTNLRKAAR